jgi:hypothetical protein
MALDQLTRSDDTAQRLIALAELYRQGQTSHLLDRAVEKMLAYEADVCRSQLAALQTDLLEFEQHYRLSSRDFYARYQAGQTDDRMDFVEWASLVQMTSNLEQRLRLLVGEAQA